MPLVHAGVLINLGMTAHNTGEIVEAVHHYTASIALLNKEKNAWTLAVALNNRGIAYYQENHFLAAENDFQESLDIRIQLQDRVCIAVSLFHLALLNTSTQHWQCAATLFGVSEALRKMTDSTLSSGDKEEYDTASEKLRSALSEEAFLAATEFGRRMAQEPSMASVLRFLDRKLWMVEGNSQDMTKQIESS